jgi:hypothetical protein
MAEEKDSPQPEEEEVDTGEEDEDIWDSAPEVEDEDDPTEETEAEAEEDTKEEVKEEADDSEEEEEEDPAHDYEQRYKSLEKEFHKRNETSARDREEFNDLRIRSLEQDKELETLKKGYKAPDTPPDPSDEGSFFDDDDRTTMEEFSELTGVTKKLVQHEVAKALNKVGPAINKDSERVAQLEKAYQDQNYQQFLSSHEKSMLSSVGDDYRDIDKDPDFQTYVLKSPALTKMMTESTSPDDHASVMNLWLENTDSGKGWRPAPEAESKPKAQSEGSAKKQSTRRKAASNLMDNSAPRIERNTDNMSDEDLWDSVPEPKEDF